MKRSSKEKIFELIYGKEKFVHYDVNSNLSGSFQRLNKELFNRERNIKDKLSQNIQGKEEIEDKRKNN